jgi:hypothetical protein
MSDMEIKVGKIKDEIGLNHHELPQKLNLFTLYRLIEMTLEYLMTLKIQGTMPLDHNMQMSSPLNKEKKKIPFRPHPIKLDHMASPDFSYHKPTIDSIHQNQSTVRMAENQDSFMGLASDKSQVRHAQLKDIKVNNFDVMEDLRKERFGLRADMVID